MAKKSAGTPDVPVLEKAGEKKKKAVTPLGDLLRKDKSLVTYSMGVDPAVNLPVGSIGYEVMIQNAGFPVNCISMSIADAHAGKTTTSHVIGNWFTRAGGDVILAEGDGSLDESYVSRFYDYNPTTEEERFTAPLQHFIDALESKLDSEDPKKEVVISASLKIKLNKQLELAQAVLKNGAVNENEPLEAEILYLAQCSYRMRHVLRIEKLSTTEDLEQLVTTLYKKKLESDPELTRETLIIVDPISNFIPNELAEQEDSASGRKMGMASYLNQFFRRWSKKLGEAHIHLHMTAKQSTFIQTNPYAFYSDLAQLTTVGGGPQKLASTLLFYLEKGRTVTTPTADQDALVEGGLTPFHEGRVKVPKKKVQGGYIMPKEFRTTYWLFTERKNTRMDFDLPFMEQVFKLNLFGIKYSGGYAYVKPQFIPSEELAAKHGEEFKLFCDAQRAKPIDEEEGGIKMRRYDAVKLLLKSEAWRGYIHTILGIGHQDII